MMKTILLSSLIAISAVGSAFALKFGNGKITTTSRDVAGFKAIEVKDAVKLVVKNARTFSCEVTVDSNLQDDFIVQVVDGILKLGFKRGIHPARVKMIEVAVTMPSLSSIKASGASSVTLSGGFEGKEFKAELGGASTLKGSLSYKIAGIEAEGASRIELDGELASIAFKLTGASTLKLDVTAESLIGELEGASRLAADELSPNEVDIRLSGASRARLGEIRESLSMDVTGASHFTYSGSPEIKEQSIAGASTVKQKD